MRQLSLPERLTALQATHVDHPQVGVIWVSRVDETAPICRNRERSIGLEAADQRRCVPIIRLATGRRGALDQREGLVDPPFVVNGTSIRRPSRSRYLGLGLYDFRLVAAIRLH